jgi:hypothetical protein
MNLLGPLAAHKQPFNLIYKQLKSSYKNKGVMDSSSFLGTPVYYKNKEMKKVLE